jgi:hypothetical protein
MTVGVSVLSLALLFEVYGDVLLDPFLGFIFYEFATDVQEDGDAVWELMERSVEVQLDPEVEGLKDVLLVKRYFYLDNADTDYIMWFTQEYGIGLDDLFDLAIKYHILKEGIEKLIISKSSFIRALDDH